MQSDQREEYLLCQREVLPESFAKVVLAKRLLKQGKAANSTQAAAMAGVSRSVFYRYRDKVFSYDERNGSETMTLYLLLHDEAGVLSGLLSELSKAGANILTINQSVPVDGTAAVNVTLRTAAMAFSTETLITRLAQMPGVAEARAL